MKSLIIATACLMTAVAASGAGDNQPLRVKTGLWQVTETTTINGGVAALPPDMQARLAQMPPEERARLEAAMQARFGGVPHTTTFKSCVTEKDLKSEPWNSGSDCKWTVLTSTATDMEARGTECRLGENEGMSSEIHIKIHVVDSGHAKATFDGKATGSGHTFTLSGTHEAKWVAATCPADVQ
jgi:Protein of unknown function (DUF3617)